MSWAKIFRVALLASSLVAAASCGQTETAGGDSNTHWLERCDSEDDCGGLSCLCGVCTEACAGDENCRRFGSQAACGEVAGCDAPPSSVCVVGQGAAGSGPGPASNDPCRPFDAVSGPNNCGDVVGYTWNGQGCEAVYCSCQGSECNRLFESADACDRAQGPCYAESGVTRQCATHADCVLQFRSCCGPCGVPEGDLYIATRVDSPNLNDAGICRGTPNGACLDCVSLENPAIHAACVDGECSVLDLTDHGECASDQDCRVTTKDCCECGGDFSSSGAIAVTQSFTSHDYCDSPTCDPCVPSTEGVTATCNLSLSRCEASFP